jgi:hypothetical protein
MKHFNFKFVARKILGYKPAHNVLAETLGVSISCGVKFNHQNAELRAKLQRRTPQFIRTIKDAMKIKRSRFEKLIRSPRSLAYYKTPYRRL